jgi:hypothetical protein
MSLVQAAVESWVGSPTQMQLAMRDEIEGAPMPPSGSGRRYREMGEALLWALSYRSRVSRSRLYRGAHVMPQGWNSWTSDIRVARAWAKKSGGQLWTLPVRTRGLCVADFAKDYEHQWIVWGMGELAPWGFARSVKT